MVSWSRWVQVFAGWLLVAQSLRLPQGDYYSYRANLGLGEALTEGRGDVSVSGVGAASRQEWTSFLEVVRSAHASVETLRTESPADVPEGDAVATCASRARAATEKIVQAAGTSGSRRSLLELGSREGRLARALEPLGFERVTLVDREHPASAEAEAVQGQRISVSLEHLEIRGLSDPESTVCVAKHVCGSAMDYAIRAVGRAPVSVLALAPCCYYACDYRAYPGRAFLADLGFADERAFSLLKKLTQFGPDDFWRREDRVAGQFAMDLLDAGRVDFLLKNGMDAACLRYAEPALVSDGALETTMIVAWRAPDLDAS